MGWVAIAGLIVAAIGAAVGGYSSIKSGQNADYMAKYNAMVAQNAADEKKKLAAYSEEREREKNEALRARQRLAFNLSGVTLEGTPTELLSDTAAHMELDALAIRYGGESAGTSLTTQAQLARMQGKQASDASWWNAGSTILSGASSALSTYGNYKTYNNSLLTKE